MIRKQDLDLVFLCSENCRVKIKGISQALKKSSQRLKYSISSLEKEQIIKNPYCIFDYSYFGLILFRVYFKGGYVGEKDKSKIVSDLKENKYVTSIYELSGEYDFVIEMLSPNPSRFNKELKKITDLFPTMNNHKIILNLVTYIYPPMFLLQNQEIGKSTKMHILIGGDRPREELGKDKMAIIKNLLENPKIRLTHLANKSKMNVKTAKSLMGKLKKQKIIKGFKYDTDTDKLKLNKHRLFLKLHNLSQEREDHLKSFLLMTKEVITANKTVGDWDMEIDLESDDKIKTRSIIMTIREDFKDIIENFNIMEFYDTYKKTFLPRYLFEDEDWVKEITKKRNRKHRNTAKPEAGN